jgi:adenylylsulfate kinase
MKNNMQTNVQNDDLMVFLSSQRSAKETILCQNARVFWMCGLSGAGKSTLAGLLDKELLSRGYLSQVIDGDIVRSGLNKGLGFSAEDRSENLRRVAEVAKLFTGCGVITIVSFISPTIHSRTMAKSIIGEDDFLEVYVNSSLEICESRDVKGLYKMAREGKIADFTGIGSPFEAPENPDLEIHTDLLTVDQSISQLLEFVIPLVKK